MINFNSLFPELFSNLKEFVKFKLSSQKSKRNHDVQKTKTDILDKAIEKSIQDIFSFSNKRKTATKEQIVYWTNKVGKNTINQVLFDLVKNVEHRRKNLLNDLFYDYTEPFTIEVLSDGEISWHNHADEMIVSEIIYDKCVDKTTGEYVDSPGQEIWVYNGINSNHFYYISCVTSTSYSNDIINYYRNNVFIGSRLNESLGVINRRQFKFPVEYTPYNYNTIKINVKSSERESLKIEKGIQSLNYKINNDSDIQTLDEGDSINVVSGDIIKFYGIYNYYGADDYYNYFSSTCDFKVKGNILSLLTENFEYLKTYPYTILNSTSGEWFTHLFYNCEHLISAKGLLLPINVDYGCYISMFENCVNLIDTPNLSSKYTSDYCYYRMFKNCPLIEKAPELLSSYLSYGCYKEMFMNCSNLNYIKCLAEYKDGASLENWTYGVAEYGTFVKYKGVNMFSTGPNGIPYNWITTNIDNRKFFGCSC